MPILWCVNKQISNKKKSTEKVSQRTKYEAMSYMLANEFSLYFCVGRTFDDFICHLCIVCGVDRIWKNTKLLIINYCLSNIIMFHK